VATIVATPLGSPIDLLGGPTGFAIGIGVGLVAGSSADLHNVRVNEDFVDDVKKDLLPKKFAVVSEIKEDWTTPVDTRMEAIRGTVFHDHHLAPDVRKVEQRYHLGHQAHVRESLSQAIQERYQLSSEQGLPSLVADRCS